MTRSWPRPAILSAGLVLAACALACGRTATENGGEAPAAPRPATENQINPMPRDQVQDGGRLTWPINSMPVTFNYHFIDGTEASHAYSKLALMPVLFHTDSGGTPHWNADYLESEPVLVTEPLQQVTYRINPRASWYDGTPITWEDFHWQWRALNGSDKAYQIASSSGYAEIERVERGRDDREVVVTFRDRYADWQPIFSPLYPASTNRSPQVFNEGWRRGPLTTAGPFKVERIDLTAQTVTLVRNEKWWGDPARLDTIVFRAIDIDAQIDALANGEIDLMDIGPDVNKFTRAQGIAAVEIRSAGGPNFRHLTINGTSPVLQDVRVRRALAMGIDRSAIARAMLGPLGIEPRPLGNHIFMANQTGYQDNAGSVGSYDPAAAAQLLDEAGWRREGGGVRRRDGRTLEIRLVIPSAIATSRQESELIQNMLGQIGVSVRIDTVPLSDFFEKYVTPGQFDVTIFSWMGTPFPISSSRSIYARPVTGPGGELAIQQNYARIGTDEIDRLFAEATRELDRTRAIELANRLDALIWQEVHSLTLYQRPELIAVKRELANVGAFGFADIVYQDIGWVKR